MASTLKQRKQLSQVFLQTSEPCIEVCAQLQRSGVRSVLEIGPGNGILTEQLLKHGFEVTCVERDERYAQYLRERFARECTQEQLKVIAQDILRFDFDAWETQAPEPRGVCGNIPYHISSLLILWLLPKLSRLEQSVFLLQLEFAQRLVSEPSSKSYGSLSVFAQLRARLSLLAEVGRECFKPIPKVDSALVAFEALSDSEDSETLLKVEKLTKLAFSQRRKKLSNALHAVLADIDWSGCTIDPGQRPDALSPHGYVELAKRWKGGRSIEP